MFCGLIWFPGPYIDPDTPPNIPCPPYQAARNGAGILINILPMSFLVFTVVGTIILGIATPTESAGPRLRGRGGAAGRLPQVQLAGGLAVAG